jgi:hypothetical protein
VASAWLHVTAHGIYEAFINGTRVGDEELRPGFTAYRRRLQVQTYDVTGLVTEGVNVLGALVSDGWWRGQHGFLRQVDSYGPATGFLAELRVTLRGGGTVVAGTGPAWRSAPSHVLAADLMAGEVHDLRRRRPGWSSPGADRSGWDPVRVAWHGYEQLCPTAGPPVRRIQELPAISVTELAPGRHVADFGQNSNGWVRLRRLGPAGTRLTITYGECLDAAGDVTQDNVKDSPVAPARAGLPFQTDVVVSAGDGSEFEPRHSTKGFRYARIEGHPGPLAPADVTSIVVHTDLRRTGAFECSDERVNRLHQVAEWSFRGNACEIPTDCPTRERSGWTGDWQIYVPTAAYLYDVTDFSAKWLADLAADQRETGAVTSIVPDPAPDAPIAAALSGSAGWGMPPSTSRGRSTRPPATRRYSPASTSPCGGGWTSPPPVRHPTDTQPGSKRARTRHRTRPTCGTPAGTSVNGSSPAPTRSAPDGSSRRPTTARSPPLTCTGPPPSSAPSRPSSATTPPPPSTPRWPAASLMPGAVSSPATTAWSGPPPRPTSSGRWPSASSPARGARPPHSSWPG